MMDGMLSGTPWARARPLAGAGPRIPALRVFPMAASIGGLNLSVEKAVPGLFPLIAARRRRQTGSTVGSTRLSLRS